MPDTFATRRKRAQGWLVPFFLVLSFMAYLSFKISLPLIKPLAWATLLSFSAYPFYKLVRMRLLGGRAKNLSALLTTALIVVLLALPAVFGGYVAAREGLRLYGTIADTLATLDSKTGESILAALLPDVIMKELTPWMQEYPIIGDLLNQTGRWIGTTAIATSKAIVESTFTIAYSMIIIIMTSFFLLRDGHLIVNYLMDITPLPPEEKKAFLSQAKEVLQAVLYGVILTASLQGFLGGIGWWYVGLPSPVFFGALMMILAMIPFVGTPVVWGIGGIYLLLSGQMVAGITLLLWGVLVVSMIDNFVRPVFISGGTKVHTLITFIGVLGGLAAWGFIGLFLGPVVISLFMFLLESYRTLWKSSLSKQQATTTAQPPPT
ncbi:MAG TPA: AI-2E family transporter [Synergistaceae bacterium]|nr:AI-2E family transporter [Synergistaceae bacterium]